MPALQPAWMAWKETMLWFVTHPAPMVLHAMKVCIYYHTLANQWRSWCLLFWDDFFLERHGMTNIVACYVIYLHHILKWKPLEQLGRAEAFLVAAGLVDMFIILPMIDTDGIGGFRGNAVGVWNVWISGTWIMSCTAHKWIDFSLNGVWLHKKAGGSYQIFKRTYVKKFVTTCLTTRWRHRLHWVPGEPKNIVLLRLVRALKAFRAMRMVRTFWPECGAEFPSVSGGCGSDCHFGHIFGVLFPLPNRNRHGWHGGVSKIRGWWS